MSRSSPIAARARSLGAAARRGLPEPLRRVLRPVKWRIEGIRMMGDRTSARLFARLVDDRTQWSAVPDLVEVRPRALQGSAVRVRPRTDDWHALRSVFLDGYHLPPRGAVAREAGLIWDLGSHIGLTIAHMAVVFPGARIIGVELDPANAALCRRNIAPWADRCELVNAAVWSTDLARVGLERRAPGITQSAHVVLPAEELAPGQPSAAAISLDSLLRTSGADEVDFVKMDIEGAEEHVLHECTDWATAVRAIKVEVHAPYTLDACVHQLRALGFAPEPDLRHGAAVYGARAGHRGSAGRSANSSR